MDILDILHPEALKQRLEKIVETLERNRSVVPPAELQEFDEFVQRLRDTIEILRSGGSPFRSTKDFATK